MTRDEMKRELVERLMEMMARAGQGFAIDDGAPHHVLLLREGHVRGIWHVGEEGCDYFPAGYNEAVHWGQSVEQAVAITAGLLITKPGE